MSAPKSIRGAAAYERGLAAEEMAAQHLRAKEFEILEMRYKTPHGEIDILAMDGEYLVAVEVKSRKTIDQALESITPRARHRIQNALLHYLSHNEFCANSALRFDVVAIAMPIKIQHLDNAWQPQA